jgi:DNA-binding NtrC family response regulator
MPPETIVVLGNMIDGHPSLEPVFLEFEWSIQTTLSLDGLADLSSQLDVLAVLVDPALLDLPWKQTLAAVQRAAPRALPILCHRFSDAIDWTEAANAGAFHLLGLPLNTSELRQSLGFVWAEKNKRPQVIPLTPEERPESRPRSRTRARGHVA